MAGFVTGATGDAAVKAQRSSLLIAAPTPTEQLPRLVSYPNRSALVEAEVSFIAPLAGRQEPDALYLARGP